MQADVGKYQSFFYQRFNYLSILEVFYPVNEGLTSDISVFGKT